MFSYQRNFTEETCVCTPEIWDAVTHDPKVKADRQAATEAYRKYGKGKEYDKLKKKLPLVIATTGHTPSEKAAIAAAAERIPIFFSANMSVGVALLVKMARETAKMFPDADIEIVEAHHNRKLDVPSGTALMIAEELRSVRPEAELVIGRHENGRRKKTEIPALRTLCRKTY